MIIKPGLCSPRYDSRNYRYYERTPPDDTKDQAKIIIQHDVPIINQGKIVPCCVSIAVTTCLEVLDGNEAQPLSFMYNYYWARNGDDRSILRSLTIRDGLNAAARIGICIKSLHDVSLDRVGANQTPGLAADKDAETRKITLGSYLTWSYEEFENGNKPRVDLWRNAIQCGIPVIMGFYLTNTYEKIPEKGNTHIRPQKEQGSNKHAVTVMGYDNHYNNHQIYDSTLKEPGAFLIRDSVGDIFPENNGCWWLPYELASSNLIVESWAVIDVSHNDKF